MPPRRRPALKRSGVAALAVLVVVGAAACGGSKTVVVTTSTTPSGNAPTGQRPFAKFVAVYDAGLDYLDPGLSYTTEGWQALWNVYLSLLGYKHVNGPDGATLVPALAAALPHISADGRTYTLTLRPGLEYSDGSPVKASDFAYAIKRVFLLDSLGARFFGNVVGAASFAQTRKGGIAGIKTDDATRTISITLVEPQGDFQNVLATTFAAPVPSRTPATDQSATPIPSTGPYMIESNDPGRQFVLVRNRHFQPSAAVPATNPDQVTFKLVQDDTAALQQVMKGDADWDGLAILSDQVADVQQKYPDRLKVFTPGNTYYFFMNTRQPPFDKLAVRRAVNYAIDRSALVRLYGGLAAPTENILPPTYPQYRKHTLYPYDLTKAKRLIDQAGAKGADVTVWGRDSDLSEKAVGYLQGVLKKIGLDAKQKIVNSATYWDAIGNQSAKAQIGFAQWLQDYPHPLNVFDTNLNGNRITEEHNTNYANFDDAAVNKQIDRLGAEPTLTAGVNRQWAALDRAVMEQAPWAPYVNRELTDFFSSDVDLRCYVTHVLYQFDFSRICLK
jgi:peptide/nickel transport system substrate-binding protein